MTPKALSRRDAVKLFALALPGLWASAVAQPVAAPEFDVTSVKPSRLDGWQGVDTMPGRIRADSITLNRCIRQAYNIGPHQLIGGPDWILTDRWEIVARADRPVDDDDTLMLMLRSLLADRFQLVVHRETRNLPAYVLEVNRSGPKMQKAAAGDSDTEMQGGRGRVMLAARKVPMDELADILGRRMDRPVVNRTGLSGGFNFSLHWAADSGRSPSDGAVDDVSIFTALGEQLGLRLRTAKAPVEVLVIDHVERPSEN